jgi:hypothetical protein
VSHPRRTRRSRETEKGDVAIIHRTVRWCTALSGEPTVASANGRPRNLRTTRGSSNGRRGAPDCPVCTGQCPVRQRARSCNGRLCPIWKEIAHRICYSRCPVAHQIVLGFHCSTRRATPIALHGGDSLVLGNSAPRRFIHHTQRRYSYTRAW